MVDEVQANGSMMYVQSIRNRLLGCRLEASGRVINDGQGSMILCNEASIIKPESALLATELRAQWGME
jgi:hypothetical protein